MFFSPAMNDFYAAALAEGFARPGARHTARPSTWSAARSRSSPTTTSSGRPTASGPRSPSTSAAWAPAASTSTTRSSPGWATRREARAIQDAYLAGDKRSAIAAVPTPLVEDVALIGPWAKIADEIQRWKQTVLTTFCVSCDVRYLSQVADLVRS